MNELDILQLNDKEMIEFLNWERNQLVSWLNSKIETARKEILPIPHPLSFSLSTDEEKDMELHRIGVHNHQRESVISHCEYLLIAMQNTRTARIHQILKEKFPGNEYSI